jgi:hypothetical protein
MFTYPYLASALGCERQRDLLARAHQQRLARQCRTLAQASRRPAPASRWIARTLKRSRPAALAS